MRTIWKYTVPLELIGDVVDVEMGEGAEILTAGVQGRDICIWAVVESSARSRTRRLRIAGTGHPLDTTEGGIDVPATYVGTTHFVQLGLVFHVFDLGQTRET